MRRIKCNKLSHVNKNKVWLTRALKKGTMKLDLLQLYVFPLTYYLLRVKQQRVHRLLRIFHMLFMLFIFIIIISRSVAVFLCLLGTQELAQSSALTFQNSKNLRRPLRILEKNNFPIRLVEMIFRSQFSWSSRALKKH